MIETRIIDSAHCADINIKNEPFTLWGRMLPAYADGVWTYTTQKRPAGEIGEMCFPDENYDYNAMKNRSVFIGAYDGDKCVGLAIMQDAFFKYMYLYDLKVDRAYRGRGTGAMLIEHACTVAAERGYRGVYTVGQDDNLSACLFYLHTGFRIGGLDTDVYKHTKQEGKADILFYRDL